MRRLMIGLVLAVLAMAAGPTLGKPLVTLPDWKTVKVTTQDLGHGIYMLQGFGGNIGVSVGPDGIFMVDDEYAPLTKKIRAALRAISDQPVRFVVNTHWHMDHVGGNENFAKAGALIIAHKETRRIMAMFVDTPSSPENDEAQFSPRALPMLTYDTALTFHLNGETIEVRHVAPAHTSGDSIVFFHQANVIQTGDTYFNGFYPFIDVRFGGSIDGMIALYDQLYAMADADTKIIPGHGPIANRENVREYQAMLRTVRDRVARAIAKGTTIQQLVAAKPLADLDPKWGGNLIKAGMLLPMVYKDLQKHAQAGR